MIPQMIPKALIIRTAGTNCDLELAHAFELAGASIESIHLNELVEHPAVIEQVNLIGFPGGFSYGDDIAAGRILANRLRHRLLDPLQAAVKRGVPMIGICNGFQVMVKMGLLPDPETATQTVTLADNSGGRFIAKWVGLTVPQNTVCIWTRNLGGQKFDLPIAHGEGRFVAADDQIIQQLEQGGRVAMRYTDNPNGSVGQIAGICDPTGQILGLMPHPERCVRYTQHPAWTSLGQEHRDEPAFGLRLIQSAVDHVRQAASTVASSS
jgi:phosphoribosylformylglycinamidine synthase I